MSIALQDQKRLRWGQTLVGVFGIDRTTVHDLGTHSVIMEIVVPAKMEINNLFSSASDIPGAFNKPSAS